ncbi:glycoside hydrolase family 95 protein [Sphingobacterium sp. E70]|uniref:glycoside hydrolase family 95 protein n=1 Tax=Sphingobacterium sp. E70 TaxID=2853439 RepID=UPI00211D1384|nr:glycoside hydrolase family 95 protein [Sphingobacterium sp. E70]ULT26730.1 glycoside hydrolase family 95 protein [Sphingobacterium sp. E70]
MNIKFISSTLLVLVCFTQSQAQQQKNNATAASQRQQKIDQFWTDRAQIKPLEKLSVAPLSLVYTRPAKVWEEALPLGNGQLGAMVFGELPMSVSNLTKVHYGLVRHRIPITQKENLPSTYPTIAL